MRSRQTRRIAFRLSLILAAGCLAASPVDAQTTPADPSAAQPSLPPSSSPTSSSPTKPGSPVVESLVDQPRPPLDVRKHAGRIHEGDRRPRHRRVAHRAPVPRDLERPALAGVELVAPLPRPGEPPHIVVPMPEYPLDSVASALTTPAPPIVCHRVSRDPDVPDPHLYRETTVACVPDNP